MDSQQQPLLKKERSIPFLLKMVMGIGVSSVAAFDSVIATYSTIFFLNVVGMDGIDFGNIQLISHMWDSITDPLIGHLSDRYVTRWGRRRHWIILGSVPLALSYFLMWTTTISRTTYFYLGIFILYETFSTMVYVPFLCLMGEMSESYNDATTLNSYRTWSQNFTNMLATVGTSVLLGFMNEKDAYVLSALIFALLCVPSLVFAGYFAREKSHFRISAQEDIPVAKLSGASPPGTPIYQARPAGIATPQSVDKSSSIGASDTKTYDGVDNSINYDSSFRPSSILGDSINSSGDADASTNMGDISNNNNSHSNHGDKKNASRRAEEIAHRQETEKVAVKDRFFVNIRSVFKNTSFMLVLSIHLSGHMAAGFYTASLLLYAQHVLGITGGWLTLLLFVQNFSRTMGVPTFWMLTTKYGKRQMMLTGCCIYILWTSLVWFCDQDNSWSFFILVYLKGFFMQSLTIPTFASVPDIVDKDELENNVRREGSYFSVWTFFEKVIMSIALAFSSYILAWSGYVSPRNEDYTTSSFSEPDQPDLVIFMLKVMQVVIPSCFLLVGLMFGYHYDMTRADHDNIVAAIRKRRTVFTVSEVSPFGAANIY